MIALTPSAIRQLKRLIAEHPEDSIVRLTLEDLDETRLGLRMTLESSPQPDDEVQDCDGLIVAIHARSAPRMDGVTLDYQEPGGFRFLHPTESDDMLQPFSLN